jgi:hypothetical protein
MKSTTLFLVCIIACASATSLRRTLSATKKMEVLAELDLNPVANMIMS